MSRRLTTLAFDGRHRHGRADGQFTKDTKPGDALGRAVDTVRQVLVPDGTMSTTEP